VLVLTRAAPVALTTFALLLPANAQSWGNSWGWHQQQPYNPYGGFGRDRQWDYWGYRQRERHPSSRVRDREQPPDYSHAPPATPHKDATVKIVVMGDANADWLAYGLEDAFSEKPEIGIVRKHRSDSGLIWYDRRRDGEWPQVAREIIAAEKPNFIVMMIGNNDHQTIREKAPPPAPNALPTQPAQAGQASPADLERQPVEQQHLTPAATRSPQEMRRADGPTISAGRVAWSMSSQPRPSWRRLTRQRMAAPKKPSPPRASRRWTLTPLRRARSRSLPSAAHGLVSITMPGLTSVRTSRSSGRMAGKVSLP
jgi:hypothetical protein